MGLFDKLLKLLNKNNKTPSTEISELSKSMKIDIRNDGFIINGKKMEVPMHIDAFSAILGKPRAVKFKTDKENREFLEEMHNEPVTKRVNYTWDDLGLMCYTLNGKVVNTFGICLNPKEYYIESDPRTLFGGTVTIMGDDWFEAIMMGVDKEIIRDLGIGDTMLVTAEYVEPFLDDSERDKTSFTGLEIQLLNIGDEDDEDY
ncbi:MAG: hypothetical protein K2N06_10485 [Oscillospiraceae bacterium]|nr:hypothetical protein [Oscillospiraceae bacterium]